MLLTKSTPTDHQHQKQIRTADWTSNMQRSVLREMLAVVSKPGILSFAGGLPDPKMFPTREFARATQHVLNNDRHALQYGPPFEPLKEHISVLMAERGVNCSADQIFITTGAQQALNVICCLLMNSRDPVMIERTIYSGIQQVIAPYKPNIIDLESNLESGVSICMIEQHLIEGQTPAFLYLVPDSHNPLGVTINIDRRRKLAELAQEHQLPVIEDDPYGLLRYDGEYIPSLRALNDEWIFYVGSFSKILAPALRLGWMVIPEALRDKLTVIKVIVFVRPIRSAATPCSQHWRGSFLSRPSGADHWAACSFG
jgi:2-aminoadipate transaminase